MRRTWIRGLLVPVVSVVVFTGCRDAAPLPILARDLGSEEQPLPPTSGVWTEAAIQEGQAEWIPLRALESRGTRGDAERPTDGESPGPSEESGESGGDAQDAEAILTELLAAYNKLAADHAVGEMVKYFVEEQESALRAAFESLAAARESVAALRTRLVEREGAEVEAIDAAFERLNRFLSGQLRFADIHAHDDVLHVVFESGSFLAGVHAVQRDREWYLEVVSPPSADDVRAKFSSLIQRLQALTEEPPAEAPAAAIEALDLPVLGSVDEPDARPSKSAELPEEGEAETE